MLVLSRKLNEKIVIDGGIVVTVVKIDRNQVRLGIEAPGACACFPRRDCRSGLSGDRRSGGCGCRGLRQYLRVGCQPSAAV